MARSDMVPPGMEARLPGIVPRNANACREFPLGAFPASPFRPGASPRRCSPQIIFNSGKLSPQTGVQLSDSAVPGWIPRTKAGTNILEKLWFLRLLHSCCGTCTLFWCWPHLPRHRPPHHRLYRRRRPGLPVTKPCIMPGRRIGPLGIAPPQAARPAMEPAAIAPAVTPVQPLAIRPGDLFRERP